MATLVFSSSRSCSTIPGISEGFASVQGLGAWRLGVLGLGLLGFRVWGFRLGSTHRPLSSSFLGLPYRNPKINHKKELLRGLWGGPVWILGLGLRVGVHICFLGLRTWGGIFRVFDFETLFRECRVYRL